MTVYKAKGLEFEHVFLLSVHDDIWGKKAKSNSNKIGLPATLQHIRYQGSSEDELRRLLFVAITRAKHGLYLTSHSQNDSGKVTEPVKYLLESEHGGERHSAALPQYASQVTKNSHTGTNPEHAVELLWQERHIKLEPPLKSLLKGRLENYKMSPTHLNTFIDTEYGGPEAFLLRTLLRFPQAPTVDSEFGTAIHGVLDWYQKQTVSKQAPTLAKTLEEFDKQLAVRYIAADEKTYCRNKGHAAISAYVAERASMLRSKNVFSEVDFTREGVLIQNIAHITGKIDRLEIDKKAKTIHIVDFKTGKPAASWLKELKYLKYKQQLYFYKLLIEGSHTYKGYQVLSGRLEFVEPNKNGTVANPLVVTYDEAEAEELRKLIVAVWKRIQALQLGDISDYKPDYRGAMSYIASIINDL
jgi:DNA helicase-2/ATP-dependent DNA helicase PcrA